MLKVNGISVGIVTPFTRGNKVDIPGLRANLKFLLDNKIHSVSPAASSGEGGLLTNGEYEKVVRTVVEDVDGRIPVTPGAGGSSPEPIIARLKIAKDLGADGGYLSTPGYFIPNQEGLFLHFSKIMGSVDLPLLLYNAYHRTGIDLTPNLIQRLAKEHSNFTVFKEPSLLNTARVLSLIGNRLQLQTEDWLLLPAMALGATSVSSVVGNVLPGTMVRLYDSIRSGNLRKAREIQVKLTPLLVLLGIGAGGRDISPAPIKAAMSILGFAAGSPRLPVAPASEQTRREIRILLRRLAQDERK